MRKLALFILITTLIPFEIFSQVQYTGTSIAGTDASAIGRDTEGSGSYSFAAGYLSKAHASTSFAMGNESEAVGIRSFALGTFSYANNVETFAMGSYAISNADGSFAIGRNVETDSSASQAIVIGMGVSQEYKLTNKTLNSFAVGFHSTIPTLFVSQAPTNAGYTNTGKVSIGNIGNENGIFMPSAKLHIKSDQGEEASILIEPNNWESGESASLKLGNQNHGISANSTFGLILTSESNFNFEGLNTGFGVEDPKAKVHINGDLLFEQSINGIIFKSEDGNCWKGTMSNDGELVFNQIDCETLSSNNNLTEKRNKDVFIFPNPSNGELTIDYTGNENQIIVEINTITGVLVKTMKVNKGENKIYLNDISDQIVILNSYTLKGEWISTNKILLK